MLAAGGASLVVAMVTAAAMLFFGVWLGPALAVFMALAAFLVALAVAWVHAFLIGVPLYLLVWRRRPISRQSAALCGGIVGGGAWMALLADHLAVGEPLHGDIQRVGITTGLGVLGGLAFRRYLRTLAPVYGADTAADEKGRPVAGPPSIV